MEIFQLERLPPDDFQSSAALVDAADLKLFKSISNNPTHVLRHYFADKPEYSRSLRTQAHNFVLPPKEDKNFFSLSTYAAFKSHWDNTCDFLYKL